MMMISFILILFVTFLIYVYNYNADIISQDFLVALIKSYFSVNYRDFLNNINNILNNLNQIYNTYVLSNIINTKTGAINNLETVIKLKNNEISKIKNNYISYDSKLNDNINLQNINYADELYTYLLIHAPIEFPRAISYIIIVISLLLVGILWLITKLEEKIKGTFIYNLLFPAFDVERARKAVEESLEKSNNFVIQAEEALNNNNDPLKLISEPYEIVTITPSLTLINEVTYLKDVQRFEQRKELSFRLISLYKEVVIIMNTFIYIRDLNRIIIDASWDFVNALREKSTTQDQFNKCVDFDLLQHKNILNCDNLLQKILEYHKEVSAQIGGDNIEFNKYYYHINENNDLSRKTTYKVIYKIEEDSITKRIEELDLLI